MARILITGATGLLGSSLAPALFNAGHEVTTVGRSAASRRVCDLSDRVQTVEMVESLVPEIIVNLAALTNVDLCEDDPNLAYRANCLSVTNLCAGIAATGRNPYLVQISTDMVYDGQGPHSEDAVAIKNTYALSKVAGELAAANGNAVVLRTNFFGRSRASNRNSLSDWLYRSLRDRTPITVFSDVLFSPVAIPTLCRIMLTVLEARPLGVYNLGSQDGLSKADFAFEFAKRLGWSSETLTRGRLADGAILKARRPTDMRMNSARLSGALRLSLPTLTEEIKIAAEEYHD